MAEHMSTNIPEFRSVMRGFDPAQVNATLAELTAALEAARREAADRTVELTKSQTAHAELARKVEASIARISELEQAQQTAATPSYQDLGERIGKILHLADAEAQNMRESAEADAQQHRNDALAAAALSQTAADRYADDVRTRAEADAALVVEEARRQADSHLDDASRSAAARRGEAEALYESQRAKAASAAADFETTLAARRDQAAEEFSAQLTTHEESLKSIQARAAALQQEADAAHAEAKSTSAHTLETARAEATQHVQQAREHAERIRHDSERELTAATQRRDSINSQLANVRQMLATLGGAALAQQSVPDAPAAPAEVAATPESNGAVHHDQPEATDANVRADTKGEVTPSAGQGAPANAR